MLACRRDLLALQFDRVIHVGRLGCSSLASLLPSVGGFIQTLDDHAMDPNRQMLSHVCDLLGRVPGVIVGAHRKERGVARIAFSVLSHESAKAHQRAGIGASVPIEPWEKGVLVPGSDTFVAPTKRDRGYSGLQILGIHLSWYLHGTGALETAQANALLRRWQAAEVGS